MHFVSRSQVNQARAQLRYSKLACHIRSVHLNWQEMMAPLVSTATLSTMQKARKIYGWLDWVVSDNHDFGFCSKATTRKYTNLPPLSRNTFMKYLHLTVAEAQQSIAQTLPKKVCPYI
ncbi:hypothetical protein DFJ73DRAFT_850108 [Zopfochytrium polystomum]|nr:hypothetical protein DFJ73DRAFT_850108 [Zopfochytrium polystomum]